MSKFQVKKASKKQLKIKIGLQGSAGSGKTFSALRIAEGMVNGDESKICVIDTENESASLYADHFGEFLTIDFKPPYSPERCVEAIDAAVASGAEVVIFDSISHEWMGSGGILDIHGGLSGNDMLKWAKLTPRHNKFIEAILQAPVHFISTMRSKQEYALEENNKGKVVPRKIGMKAVTKDGVDYEFSLNFDIDISNYATAMKDRTSLFKGKPERVLDESVGKEILSWCQSGENELETAIDKMGEAKSKIEAGQIWASYKKFQTSDAFIEAKENKKKEFEDEHK